MFQADPASSGGGSAAVAIIVWIVLIAVYWAPTIVGAIARKSNLLVIAAWNFFAWFLFFPWIVAWVKVAEKPQQPTVVFAPPYGWQPPPGPMGAAYPPPPVQPQPQARVDNPYGDYQR